MKRAFPVLVLAFVLTACIGASAWAAEYTLGPGDQLLIRIENHPDLTMTVTVQPDGYITFPLAGGIPAHGLTISQLQDQLTQRLKPSLANFLVSVMLVQARPLRVQVIGEVRVPGHLALPQGSTATQAIAQAGGPTEKAELEGIMLTRRGGEKHVIDFKSISEGGSAGDLLLAEGDTIVVPKGTIKVSIAGEVVAPGVYEIQRGSRLLDAIAAAGGPKNTAALSRIRVYEGVGAEQKASSGKMVFSGPMSDNPVMADGYVVMVGRNHFWDVSLVVSIISVAVAVIDLFVP